MDYGNTVKERIETFEKLHGPDYAFEDRGFIYYPDGAMRDPNPLGVLREPPEDPRQLHSNIARYFQIRLDQIVEEFDRLKQQLQQNPGIDPNDENVKKLRKLRANAQHFKSKLAEHQELLRQHSPGYLTPQQAEEIREFEAAEAARKQKFADVVSAITI